MATEQPAGPMVGAARVTIHLDTLSAIQNPERWSKGDWDLRLWINGIERWQNADTLYAAAGETVHIGESVVTEVAAFTDLLELKVEATEKDPLNPDDHASGTAQLYRTHSFIPAAGASGMLVDIQGDGAHIQLMGRVESELL